MNPNFVTKVPVEQQTEKAAPGPDSDDDMSVLSVLGIGVSSVFS